MMFFINKYYLESLFLFQGLPTASNVIKMKKKMGKGKLE